MIIRKPYAFLIKNFRKIHIAMLALAIFVYFKTLGLSSFVNEFIEFLSYDPYNEPVSRYTGFFTMLFILVILVGSVMLLILLKKKNKPWKSYLLVVAEYAGLLILFAMINNFFGTFTAGDNSTIEIRAYRDVLNILVFPQYLVILLMLVRVVGLDLNKFDFQKDSEYLELEEDDRDEVEISFEFDKHSIIRFFKKFLREMNYFCREHKKAVALVIFLFVSFIGYQGYKFIFITNKSYTQGDVINSSGYVITIHNAYYTNKDDAGKVISDDDGFIILDLSIKNNAERRNVNFNRFHVMNGRHNYTQTGTTYATAFSDLGRVAPKTGLDRDEDVRMLLVFKVSPNLRVNRFVLYYQEFVDRNKNHLRKIKLKVKNLSEIKDKETVELGNVLTIEDENTPKDIIFDNIVINDSTTYRVKVCEKNKCEIQAKTLKAKTGKKIMTVDFASNDFTGKELVDFLLKYGKIYYIDNSDNDRECSIVNALPNTEFYGKHLYIEIPNDVKSLQFAITMRNYRYIYKLK